MDRLWLRMERTTEARGEITSQASHNFLSFFSLISLTTTIVPSPSQERKDSRRVQRVSTPSKAAEEK